MKKIAFPYSEARLAEQIGRSRGRLRDFRTLHLEENSDWQKNGAEIALSKDGVNRICVAESVPAGSIDLSQCLVQKNGEKTPAAPKKMMVVAPMPINQRLVLAEDELGERWPVDVGKNETFVFGDEIEVGPHETQKGIWQLLGPVPRDRRRPMPI